MSSFIRNNTPDSVRKLVSELEAVGVKAPSDVRDALALIDRIDARRPAFVDAVNLTDAYFNEDDDDTLERKVAQHVAHAAQSNAWTEARIKAGQAARQVITANGDDLTRALARKSQPLIEQMQTVAKIDTLDTSALIRDGRSTEAEAAARADLVAGDLANLYRLRGQVTKGASYGEDSINCGVWKDPRPVTESLNSTPTTAPLEVYRRGIQAGGELWFPTPGEAEQASRPIAAEARAKAQAKKDRMWGVGSMPGRVVTV